MVAVKSADIAKILETLSKHDEVIIMSKADFLGMQATAELCAIPGMREKLIEGMNTPLNECEELEWDIQ